MDCLHLRPLNRKRRFSDQILEARVDDYPCEYMGVGHRPSENAQNE
jgi:proteasome lid subunit RPN8/RPN11